MNKKKKKKKKKCRFTFPLGFIVLAYYVLSGVPRILQMCMHILFCVLCVCEEKKAREEYVLHFVPTFSYATVNPP